MRNAKWKVLESQFIFNDPWLKVRREKCETPSGKIVEPYYVYDFTTWVGGFSLTKDGKVIMIRQYRHALGEECIEIPGGCVDSTDANLEAAIRRELLEETGYQFDKVEHLGGISPNPSTNSNLLHMFLATGGEKVASQSLDENEEIEVLLLSMDELKQLLRENKIIQSMHVSCMLYALNRLGELRY